jgi:hypothetical protein
MLYCVIIRPRVPDAGVLALSPCQVHLLYAIQQKGAQSKMRGNRRSGFEGASLIEDDKKTAADEAPPQDKPQPPPQAAPAKQLVPPEAQMAS